MNYLSPYLIPIAGVLSTAGQVFLIALGSVYALWVFYLALTNVERVGISGKLSYTAFSFILPALLVGVALDILVNLLVFSLVFLEVPREWTVSDRLRRHKRLSTGWRQRLALWFESIMDPFDADGDHV